MTPLPPVGAVADREKHPQKLWTRLRHAWAALMGHPPQNTLAPTASAPLNTQAEWVDTAPSPTEASTPPTHDVQPYNPQALPAAREQWQRGDWAALAALTLDDLQDHPDRAKLALLAAAGHMQLGRQDLGADCLRQAKAWGCSPQLMRQMVIAGVHNTLGKAAALADMPDRAEQHFAASLRTVMPMKSGQYQVAQRRESQVKPLAIET